MRKHFLTILIIVILLVVFVVSYRNMKVTSISCQSQFGPCSDQILSTLSNYEGKNIIVAYAELSSQLKNHPHIANANVKFDTFQKLHISVNQRKPAVAVQAQGESTYHLYSSDGYELSQSSETQLPIVLISDKSIVTREQELFVIRMAHVMQETYNVKQILISEGGLQFKLNDPPQIIFPLDGDEDVLLGSLTFVLSQLNTQVEGLTMESVLDFRFRNPIVRNL